MVKVFTSLVDQCREELQKTVKKWFGFPVHVIADTDYEVPVVDTTRGKEKMSIHLTIAFSVMLAVALGRVRENNSKLIRSLVKPAA